jgi:hypothetical protein
LFPVGPCYHAGRSPDGRDGLVLGYAALPEHDFDPGLRDLGELLAESLPLERVSVAEETSGTRRSPARPWIADPITD